MHVAPRDCSSGCCKKLPVYSHQTKAERLVFAVLLAVIVSSRFLSVDHFNPSLELLSTYLFKLLTLSACQRLLIHVNSGIIEEI